MKRTQCFWTYISRYVLLFWHNLCLTHPSTSRELELQQLLTISFFHLRGLPAVQYTNIRPHFRHDPRRKSHEASNLMISKVKQLGPLLDWVPRKPVVPRATNCCCNVLLLYLDEKFQICLVPTTEKRSSRARKMFPMSVTATNKTADPFVCYKLGRTKNSSCRNMLLHN